MSWDNFFQYEQQQTYYQNLMQKIAQSNAVIYPPKNEWFDAFTLCSLANLKVVIIGQDPYIHEKQAHGLAFSIKEGQCTPSLMNIKKELFNEYGYEINDSTDLSCWAKQGVLLLNRILTVEQGKSNSHKNWGWENFSEAVIRYINDNKQHVVFILLGKQAQECKKWISHNHFIIEEAHPSPLSAYRGFFNSNIFINTNNYLKQHQLNEIDWEIK